MCSRKNESSRRGKSKFIIKITLIFFFILKYHHQVSKTRAHSINKQVITFLG